MCACEHTCACMNILQVCMVYIYTCMHAVQGCACVYLCANAETQKGHQCPAPSLVVSFL